ARVVSFRARPDATGEKARRASPEPEYKSPRSGAASSVSRFSPEAPDGETRERRSGYDGAGRRQKRSPDRQGDAECEEQNQVQLEPDANENKEASHAPDAATHAPCGIVNAGGHVLPHGRQVVLRRRQVRVRASP